jgi:type IV pilus assembly protein PilV
MDALQVPWRSQRLYHHGMKHSVSFRNLDARFERFQLNTHGSVSSAKGFSLLEVLISIIILSFGLLGMVGLQAASLQANKEARYQSSAVRLARELGEIMRGNKNIGTQATTTANPYLISYDGSAAIPVAATNCFTGDCYSGTVPAAAQLAIAKFEIQDWLTRVNTELPGAKVVVCFDNAPFDTAGAPRWACDSSASVATVAVIKIGWTRGATNRAASSSAAFEKATVPSVVLPVTAGSTT